MATKPNSISTESICTPSYINNARDGRESFMSRLKDNKFPWKRVNVPFDASIEFYRTNVDESGTACIQHPHICEFNILPVLRKWKEDLKHIKLTSYSFKEFSIVLETGIHSKRATELDFGFSNPNDIVAIRRDHYEEDVQIFVDKIDYMISILEWVQAW